MSKKAQNTLLSYLNSPLQADTFDLKEHIPNPRQYRCPWYSLLLTVVIFGVVFHVCPTVSQSQAYITYYITIHEDIPNAQIIHNICELAFMNSFMNSISIDDPYF